VIVVSQRQARTEILSLSTIHDEIADEPKEAGA
jgi:hypothetical protein